MTIKIKRKSDTPQTQHHDHGLRQYQIHVTRHETSIQTFIEIGDFGGLYKSDPSERIKLIRVGVRPADVKMIAERMHIQQKKLMESLGLSVATINRKVSNQTRLSSGDSERVMGMAKLIGQVETIVADSGTDSGDAKDFDAAQWTAGWLDEPNMALGGQKPMDFMDTSDGREIVSGLIARMQTGAYS